MHQNIPLRLDRAALYWGGPGDSLTARGFPKHSTREVALAISVRRSVILERYCPTPFFT